MCRAPKTPVFDNNLFAGFTQYDWRILCSSQPSYSFENSIFSVVDMNIQKLWLFIGSVRCLPAVPHYPLKRLQYFIAISLDVFIKGYCQWKHKMVWTERVSELSINNSAIEEIYFSFSSCNERKARPVAGCKI